MLAFAGFVLFCMKFVWPPILAAMNERSERIADGLAAAERARQDLELAQKEAVERLKRAKEEAAGIVDAANRRAGQIVEDAKTAARDEGERLKQAAQAEIEREVSRAREELRGEVAALALAGAEKVLGAEIDAARHHDLVAELASRL